MTRTAINKLWSSSSLRESQVGLKKTPTNYPAMQNSHRLHSSCHSSQ